MATQRPACMVAFLTVAPAHIIRRSTYLPHYSKFVRAASRRTRTPIMALSTAADPGVATALPARTPSALAHEMRFEDVRGLRRVARAWRLLKQVRGRVARDSLLFARIGGELPDAEPTRSLLEMATAQGVRPTSLEGITEALRLAAHDPRIAGVLLVLEPLTCGWARVLEVRRHLHYAAEAGKQITIFMEQGGPKEFFLAMGFELFVPPLGDLSLRGFTVSASFLRGALDKIGVAPQVERIGAYKSAGDQLNRTEMSKEQREMLQSILGEIDSVWVKSVAEACGLSEEDVRSFVERAPCDMQEFVDAKLVTGLKYLSEVRDMLILRQQRRNESEKEEDVLKRELKTVSLRNYRKHTNERILAIRGPAQKRIALVRANGAITSGRSGSSAISGQTLGSDSLVKLLRKAGEDKRIAAVVIRCDSPGGSALASDIVYREVQRLRQKKPVVASMGDVSASGGYYISMGAADIVAENLTLTGSVGVVAAKFALGELYEKVGFQKETLSIGKYAELLGDERPFTADEAAYFKKFAELSYKSFVTKAAEARGKTYEEMNEVAQGRVWTGRQALERGMIDHIGGISKAIEVAKDKANISDEQFVRIERIAESSLFARILGIDGNEVRSAQSFGVNAPLAIAEIGPLLSGPSPLVRFLAAATASMPVIAALTGAEQGGKNVFGQMFETLLKNGLGLNADDSL